jgi:hypothetical protein
MIVTISQPRYLPWMGYMKRIATSDLFIYLDNVQYTPRDWENRNKIKTDQGWAWLSVPVKARYRARIPEVTVDNEQAWQEKQWKTIQTYYNAAPFFSEYAPRLETIYQQPWEALTDLNLALTDALCECLGIQGNFARASELNVEGRGSELLLNLCKAVKATAYVSGPFGRDYLDAAAFEEAGIAIQYDDYQHPVYEQLHGEFQPSMAVIDLLFNCGPRSKEILLGES